MNKIIKNTAAIIAVIFVLSSCSFDWTCKQGSVGVNAQYAELTAETFPEYSGQGYIEINGNKAYFDEEDIVYDSFEYYSNLDSLGRCGAAYACLGRDLMPTKKRGNISSVKPSGWHSVKYDFVEQQSLYNRSHLIGWQLADEDANEKNLITGTRYLNATLMLPFENMVAEYIKNTDNHVMYRVTPFFEGENLVAKGVLMEAQSVEDNGRGVRFNVFCYNIQPGVEIDYATGDSHEGNRDDIDCIYILNTGTKKFHRPSCKNVSGIRSNNKQKYSGLRQELINWGYEPCGWCNP